MKPQGMMPPNAAEFEALVLGACLIDKNGLKIATQALKDILDAFYDPRHREIYRAIRHLVERNLPVDLATVIAQLNKTGDLERAGGDGYIIDLSLKVSSVAHTEYHCRVVWEKYLKRCIIDAGQKMAARAYEESTDAFELLEITNRETSMLQNYLSGQKPIKSFQDVHEEFIQYVKAEAVPGVPMPFSKLQEENQGWQNSDLIIIAGRPGMGKTALALEIARFAAKNDNAIHFFSLEMANIQLHKRIVANELGISANRIRKKRFTEEDKSRLFSSSLEKINLFYDDSLFQWEEIKARARFVAEDKRTKMIIIDYLQLISTKQKMSTIDRVSFVSRELKMLAKELNVPVIALSQLSREVEKRADKKPQLADLRESGAIEQDADIILFPYRPEYYGIPTWQEEEAYDTSTEGKALLMSAKNRHCGESDLVIGWEPEYQRFYDLDTPVIHYAETEKLPPVKPGNLKDAFGSPDDSEMPF